MDNEKRIIDLMEKLKINDKNIITFALDFWDDYSIEDDVKELPESLQRLWYEIYERAEINRELEQLEDEKYARLLQTNR